MKKFIIFILCVCFAAALPAIAMAEGDSTIKQASVGDDVALVQMRLRDLGYFNYRPTGRFSDMTAAAVRSFQQQNGIAPDGQVGSDTYQALFSDTVKRAPIGTRIKKVSGPGYSGTVKEKGELSSWAQLDPLIPVDAQFTVTDFNTGKTFQMARVGGQHCAYVTTVSAADYEAYRTSFGGDDTWEHRAVLVEINGTKYAASLFGQPSGGDDLYGSGMKGHTFLYFNDSRTDISGLADDEHVIAITRAAAQK